MDSGLTLTKQVNYVKSTRYNKLRAVAKMKTFLNKTKSTMLIQATISSSLDYCNALNCDVVIAVLSKNYKTSRTELT